MGSSDSHQQENDMDRAHATSQTDHERATMERFAALSHISVVLMSERDEEKLLRIIAQTARDLTGAAFAAFTLRPTDELGQPLVPSEGNLFHLAAVYGVTPEQKELFRHMPLGGEGLLAPIFRYGVPVRIPDVSKTMYTSEALRDPQTRQTARDTAFSFAHGHAASEDLRSLGIPRGHPHIRSFLGAPLLDQKHEVRGGLLLGHPEPDCFTEEDEVLLVGLAAQAAVALENARLYRAVEMRAHELTVIFQSITDGITLIDQHGSILRENSSAQQLRARLSMLPDGAQMLNQLLHEPARQALQGFYDVNAEISVPGDQSEPRIYIVNASPLRQPSDTLLKLHSLAADPLMDGLTSGAVVIWKDVTEARRLLLAHRMYKETETRRALLQYVLDEIPGSVYLVYGHDARLLLANAAALAVWGALWPVGMPMRTFLESQDIHLFSTDGRPLAPEQLATFRALHHGETVHHYQEIIRYANGSTLPVLVNAIALDAHHLSTTLPQGETERERVALVVHQDVTALREAEQLKDDFIAIAAHELRNPLAVLKGFAQMLLIQNARGNGPELADWQMEALEGIDQSSVRLVELMDDLLDVTRLQAGRLELHLEILDLRALTRRVVSRLQMTSNKHHLAITSPEEPLLAHVDPRRLEQVLANILNNAIKYSPNGGTVTISLETLDSQQTLIRVQDTGIGIPAHQQARIFGRFVRGDNAEICGIRGTGLGLYLCRELVERQGGRIWFESTEGVGTTFFVQLPLFNPDTQETDQLS